MRITLVIAIILVAVSGTLARPDKRNFQQHQTFIQVHQQPQRFDNQPAPNLPVAKQQKKNSNEEKDSAEETDDKEALVPTIDTKLVERVLQDEQKTSEMVDCVLHYKEGCPKQLERVHRIAPEIFRRGGRCFRCSAEERSKLRRFLVLLQRKQPSQYRRMISELNQL